MVPNPSTPRSFMIDMEPIGKRAQVLPGKSILDIARESGVKIVSLCGGEGWCESCIIKVESGQCQPPTESEQLVFSSQMIDAGYRLACQAIPQSNVKLYIPPDSLSAPQRLQIEGQELDIVPDPSVTAVDLILTPPSLTDLSSDTRRIQDRLFNHGFGTVRFDFPLLATLSDILRLQNWKVRLVIREDEVVSVLPFETNLFGLAVDIGTTKLAGYLVDLDTGKTVAKSGAMNPQIAYGEDVVSRIAYSREGEKAGKALQSCLVEALNDLVNGLCSEVGIRNEQVVQAIIVGNTAMHHLFAGLPVSQLAMAPYVPSVDEGIAFRAARIGLKMNPGCYVQLLPNIAGYVGADHVAAILATELWKSEHPSMMIDIGTNTEISLAVDGHIFSCSCASGPAFEGAHIRNGMRASDGAIEAFQIIDGQKFTYTIGNKKPIGICGSGILDVVAELRNAGILNDKGAFQVDHPDIQATDTGTEFVLVTGEKTAQGREIAISRRDVNEIQLAKAAIRTGIDILLETAGVHPGDLHKIIIAGAFGTYIRLESAIKIGLLPDIPVDHFMQVGNAAGIGAKLALISIDQTLIADELVKMVNYIELTNHPEFQKKFLKAMYL